MVPVLHDRALSASLEPDAEIEPRADGFEFTEGPLWLRDGKLLFQDIKAERTYRLDPGDPQPHVVRQHTGAANGQTFLPGGDIIFCEQNGRRVFAHEARRHPVDHCRRDLRG